MPVVVDPDGVQIRLDGCETNALPRACQPRAWHGTLSHSLPVACAIKLFLVRRRLMAGQEEFVLKPGKVL